MAELHQEFGQPYRAGPGGRQHRAAGLYMLFVVNTNGVPSVAKFVRFPAPWEDTVSLGTD